MLLKEIFGYIAFCTVSFKWLAAYVFYRLNH